MWVWQFGLYPLDDQRTRFVTRGAERVPKKLLWWLGMRIMEPASFIMTRRMLLGVKERAEALRTSRGVAGRGVADSLQASARPGIPLFVQSGYEEPYPFLHFPFAFLHGPGLTFHSSLPCLPSLAAKKRV